MKIVLPEFALSHFDASEHPRAIPCSPQDFEKQINERHPVKVLPGYAPFCSLWFFENWTNAQVGIVELDPLRLNSVQTRYEARRETELPVLVRFIPYSSLLPLAKYLCVVLYDAEQMAKEGSSIDGDAAIVNILRLSEMVEPPIPPITMMRNALGTSEGGSGVPLNREKYIESVAFWSKHVSVGYPKPLYKG